MNIKTQKILEKTKGKKVGLFIDNANWFYPQKELKWRISYTKLREFLEQYYTLPILKLYAGTPLDSVNKAKFKKFCKVLEKEGYTLETKPLKKIWVDRKEKAFVYKCNFDVEIALDVARHINNIDIVMIGSGDSDFLEIKEFAQEHRKGFVALCFEKGAAWEVRKHYHIFLEDLEDIIKQT